MSLQGGLAGIDIGSSKVRVVQFDLAKGQPVFKTVAEAASEGVVRGQIVDQDKMVEVLEGSISAAETASGHEITDVLFNVSGPEVKGVFSRGSLLVSRFSHRVTEWDVIRVLEIARQAGVPEGTEIICAVPRSFFVDGKRFVNPIGKKGHTLEVDAILIAVPVRQVQHLHSLAKRLGLNVQSINANIVASAGAVLDPSDKGVAVVDIGAGLTDVAIFDDYGLCWVTSLNMGGDYITGDIAFGLQVDKQDAEQIKISYGTLTPTSRSFFTIAGNEEQAERKVNTEFLSEIIQSRLEEMFQFIRNSLLDSGYGHCLQKGIVFTGAVVQTPGFIERAAEFLKVPVRVGAPNVNLHELEDPSLSGTVGLVLCASSASNYEVRYNDTYENPGFRKSITRFLREVLS